MTGSDVSNNLLNTSSIFTLRVSKANREVCDKETQVKLALKTALNLRISEPLPSGGNSNDGNTARSFFKEWETVACITGLNKQLLKMFGVLLMAINSKAEISVLEYQNYSEKTLNLSMNLYGWYVLTPTVHKLLVHGGAIIKHVSLPIGMCSEEAAETRNKCIRRFRECHARKFDRVVNIEDVFKRLLLTSIQSFL